MANPEMEASEGKLLRVRRAAWSIGNRRHQNYMKKNEQWHKWFAWHPINLSSDPSIIDARWLCWVYRRWSAPDYIKQSVHYVLFKEDCPKYWEYKETILDFLKE